MTVNYESIFTQMGMVHIVLDEGGNFIALNQTAEELFRRTKEDLIGLPFTNVLDSFSHEKARMMVERTFSEGGVNDWELDHLQPDGSPVLLGYTTNIIKDDTGVSTWLLATGINLTNKLELTEKLSRVNQDLEGALLNLEKVNLELKNTQSQLVQSEKMRALGQLVAGIAHEINNPSAFVANNLALLAKLGPAMRDLFEAYAPLKQFANNEQLEIINNAESQADIEYLWKDLSDLTHESINGIERIRNIVLSLRNFSRHDEALNKFADINEGLRNTLRLVYPSCKNRISIIEEYGEIPQIPCFPGELNQVFLNILNNAVQAIEGKGTIKIKTFQESNKIIIAISDTGSGMDPSTLQHLGEPFFTTKPIGEGTGLGLSISYEIIKHHQGNIYFKSEIGHGSTAFVEIPIQ